MTAGAAGGEPPGKPAFFRRVRLEAARLGHDAIRPEHVLVALLRDDAPEARAAARALRATGVDPELVALDADAVPGRLPRGPHAPQVPFEPATKAVLEAALEEAGGPGASRIALGHLLLGLLRDRGAAGEMLRARGATVEGLRAALAHDVGP